MEKIKIFKRLYDTDRNIFGKEVRKTYAYYIAVRRFGFLWFPVTFYFYHYRENKDKVAGLLKTDEVTFCYASRKHATLFDTEADAIRIKLDIVQHPDKYIKA